MRYMLAAFLFSVLSIATYADSSSLNDRFSEKSLKLSFGVATLSLPLDFYQSATIAPTGGLAIKFADGGYFYIKTISREEEGLPADFDMQAYPDYLMGRGAANKLPPNELDKFNNSKAVLLDRYGRQGIHTERYPGYQALVAEKENGGEIYLTFDGRTDALLLLGYSGLSKDKLRLIKEGFK